MNPEVIITAQGMLQEETQILDAPGNLPMIAPLPEAGQGILKGPVALIGLKVRDILRSGTTMVEEDLIVLTGL